MEEWSKDSTRPYRLHYTEVSHQLYAPAILVRRKNPSYLGWPQGRSEFGGKEGSPCPYQESNPGHSFTHTHAQKLECSVPRHVVSPTHDVRAADTIQVTSSSGSAERPWSSVRSVLLLPYVRLSTWYPWKCYLLRRHVAGFWVQVCILKLGGHLYMPILT